MSLLAPLRLRRRPARRHAAPTDKPSPWHVGLSHVGMFPHYEAACPCEKAPCGLAVPRPEVFCKVHQVRGPVYRQMHLASNCAFPRKGWFRRSGLTRR